MTNLNAFDAKEELEYLKEAEQCYDKIINLLVIAKDLVEDFVSKDCYTKSKFGLHEQCFTSDLEEKTKELNKVGSGFYAFRKLTSENIKAINKYMIEFKALNKDMLTVDD